MMMFDNSAVAYGNLWKRSVRMVQYVDSAGIIYGTLRAVDKTLYVQTPHQSCIQHEIFKLINPKTVPVKLFRLRGTLRCVWVKFITLTCEKCNEVALLYAKLIWRESLVRHIMHSSDSKANSFNFSTSIWRRHNLI